MWKMIEEDVRSRYLPGHGRLRLIVITDGEDTHSPGIEQTDTHARTREHTHTHEHTTHTHTRSAVKADTVDVRTCAFVVGAYCGIKGMDALMKDR